MVSFLCFVLFLSSVEATIADHPCNNASNVTDPSRSPNVYNTFYERCDWEGEEDVWYFFGGQLTGVCVDHNRCSTLAGIWYGGDYPVGDEIVTGTVCSKGYHEYCCRWTGEIKIMKCSYGFIYQLAIPEYCSLAYCVGPADSCTSVYEIYHEEKNVCLERMWFSEVKLSQPYVSKSRMFGDFNATAFAVDCKLSYVGRLHSNLSRSSVIRLSFKINEEEIEKHVFNTSDGRLVDTITLEESYLVGHLGKTDSSGKVIKDLTMVQTETKKVYLRSAFPFTFGHCLNESECKVHKYIFKVKSPNDELLLNDCQVEFENNEFISKELVIYAWVVQGRGISNYSLTFMPLENVKTSTIWDGYVIPPLKVHVLIDLSRKRCKAGHPNIKTFGGLTMESQNIGDFNMLSANSLTLQIQVRQVSCMDGETTCICGMLAREGNNLFGITACDYKNYPLVVDLMHDNVNPSFVIKKVNNDYMIKMLSGISIQISFLYDIKRNSTIMNVYVIAPPKEEYKGFCTTTTTSESLENFRVPQSESFFKDDVPPCEIDNLHFQDCKYICNDERNDVKFIRLHNVCDVRGHHERRRRSVGAGVSNDVRRTFEDVNREKDKPTKVRTSSLNAALARCSSVLARFTFSNECKNFIPETFDKIHKNCVDAIQLSGNYNLVWSNLAEYEEACVSFLKRKHAVIGGRVAIENRTLTKMMNDIIIESARRVASQRRWNETIED